MNIDLINTAIKTFFLEIFTYIICLKIINSRDFKKENIFILIFASILLSILYIAIKEYIGSIVATSIFYLLTCCIFKLLINTKSNIMVLTIISLSISFFTFILATAIGYITHHIFNYNDDLESLLVILTIEFIIIFTFFKIKKFKKGFIFLQNRNDYIDLIMITISMIGIVIYCLFGNLYDDMLTKKFFTVSIILGITMIVVIQKTLTMYYKQKLLDDTIKQYEKDLREKDAKIEELSKEKFVISKISHEFFNRQEALMLKVKELSGMNLEVADEIDVSNRIQSLTNEYSSLMQSIKTMPSLPKADIPEIDDMFKYMQSECYKNNIDFKLQVNGNIHHLVNTLISKSKLETLVGDILRDAIRAVSSSSGDYKSIFAILGLKDNFYEFCVFDSGVDFEIDTLIKLGLECVTTHKDNGGSGIGFITTFETMNECNASLIIEEFPNDSKNDYSKSITVRFDGKNEYRIVSYRANEIKEKSKDNRIIIEEK